MTIKQTHHLKHPQSDPTLYGLATTIWGVSLQTRQALGLPGAQPCEPEPNCSSPGFCPLCLAASGGLPTLHPPLLVEAGPAAGFSLGQSGLALRAHSVLSTPGGDVCAPRRRLWLKVSFLSPR